MSTRPNASSNPEKALGIDIGGTGIKYAVVDMNDGKLLTKSVKIATPRPATPKAILPVISGIIDNLKWNGPIGCGFPAVVKNGVTKSAANIAKDWIGFDALSALSKLTPHPVNIINDADAAGLAEMRFGAGKDYNHPGGGVVMMITLGTGIGTALFVNGILLPNAELGHIEIDGVDAEKNAATVIREQNNLSWEEWGERVNKYLQTVEFLLSPDAFIIGGGVSESHEKFFRYLHLDAKLFPAKMANDAGIVGAALGVNLLKGTS